MAIYYKPQSPIQSGEDFIYPITTADQIMKSDNSRRLEQAGLIVADNSTSLGGVAAKDYALKTDTAPDSAKLGGKAPEYYTNPRNLLYNSDFTNPVNQRGVYSAVNGSYIIDRWMFHNSNFTGNVTITQSANGIAITNDAGADTVAIVQRFIDKSYYDDKYTVVVKTTDSLKFGYTEIIDSENGIAQASIWLPSGTTVVWAALYEGSYTAETLPPYVPKGYAAELAACNVADTGCTDRTLINENTTSIVTGFPQKPTSASKTVFTTPADGNFYLFATRGETAGYTLRVYILNQNDGAVAQFNYPAYYAYAVIGVMIPIKRGMKIMVNTDNSVETWTIHEQKFYY